jgi:glycosyltransferase involved in cell wall biosynthesis
MKICLVVDDYMPNSIKVAAKMMHELAIELNTQGHKVTVLTPNPEISKEVDVIQLDNISVYRFKTGKIKNVGKVKRAINETLLSNSAWKSCKNLLINDKHDLIIYYSPTIFFGPLIAKLKKLWNVPSYLILRDIFPQWTIDNGILKENSIITKYFEFFESINYKHADKIGLMSQKNLEWFNKKYNLNNKTELLYNWASNTPLTTKINKYKKLYNLENKIVYFYGGNMGHAQDMMNIVRLAQNMKNHPDAHFVLVGAGDEVELIKNKIVEDDIKNITLLPSVNQEEFKEMLSEFDIGLFTLNYNHQTHNFPGKLLGYMCESKAILGSVNPNNDLKDVIESANAGYISITGQDELLYENAVKLLDEKTRINMGENANNLLDRLFTVKSIAKQILSIK